MTATAPREPRSYRDSKLERLRMGAHISNFFIPKSAFCLYILGVRQDAVGPAWRMSPARKQVRRVAMAPRGFCFRRSLYGAN